MTDTLRIAQDTPTPLCAQEGGDTVVAKKEDDAPTNPAAAQEPPISSTQFLDDERYMRLALDEAARAAALGEVPIGAVVVCNGEVIARAHNLRETDADPSAHAEFSALIQASRTLGRWRLTGCTVYVTLEPCLMCSGLMINARIDRCVFGAYDPKGGALGTLYDVSHDPRLNHEFAVTGGVLQNECAAQLKAFFAALREKRRTAKRASKADQGA